jgi:hypothetical protein
MADVPGELRCQSSGKIQGHGSGLTAFYRIEEVEHRREQPDREGHDYFIDRLKSPAVV